ncbi:hypothetical protein ACWGST_01465 [Agromyces sp. NPDC055520]
MIDHPRPGTRPTVSTVGPQRQLDQRATPELWGRLVASVFALDGVVEGHSQVSPKSSRAVFLEGLEAARAAETSLFPDGAEVEVVVSIVEESLAFARGA